MPRIQNSKSPYPKSKSRIQNPKWPYPKISKIEDTVSKNIQKYSKISKTVFKISPYPKPYPKLMKISKTVSKNIKNIQNRIQNEKISKIQSRKTFIQVGQVLDIFGFFQFCIRSIKYNTLCFSFGYFCIPTLVF